MKKGQKTRKNAKKWSKNAKKCQKMTKNAKKWCFFMGFKVSLKWSRAGEVRATETLLEQGTKSRGVS